MVDVEFLWLALRGGRAKMQKVARKPLRTLPEQNTKILRISQASSHRKSVFDVHHLRLRAAENHSHDIEPVHVAGPMKAAHPVTSRLRHLPLFPPVNSAQRTAVGSGHSSLHFNEGDDPVAVVASELSYEIDIPMPASKPTVDDSPASRGEPPFGNTLTALSE